MKALFLASGKSSRMNPLRDKNQMVFAGKPLCMHIIDSLKEAGIEEIVAVTNGENTQEIAHILAAYGVKAEVTIQKNLAEGQAGGVRDGLEYFDNDESVLVVGGNDIIDPIAYTNIQKALKNADGAILAKKVDQYFPGGYIQVDEENIITTIVEKPGEGNEPSDMVNIVCHAFSHAGDLKRAIDAASSSSDDVYEVALQCLFELKKITAVRYEGPWRALKYPWHAFDIMEIIAVNMEARISPNTNIAESAKIHGKVTIEDGVQIFDNAVIVGPAYIGRNAVIGNNALVRESFIEADSIVGYNTEVARSYFAPKVTSHMAYIGDSIIDSGVNFGAFSCTANLRLDHAPVKMKVKDQLINTGKSKLGAIVGAGSQIGIHACLMPGIKIPQGTFILPSSTNKPQDFS
jgi:NDP-sugar pyrophosphorylase family protein